MRNKTILAASLVLPLLLLACDRADQSPTSAAPSQERQAMTPSPQDKMLESSPPAAGAPPSAAGSSTDSSPANQPNEPKKAY